MPRKTDPALPDMRMESLQTAEQPAPANARVASKFTGKRVHFIGIGGSGMSGLARVLLQKGLRVSGSDLRDSETLAELRQRGAQIFVGHRATQLPAADLIVYSSAVKPDNPEFHSAVQRGLEVVRRAKLLGGLMQEKRSVAVAGAHGKTTTSAALALRRECRPRVSVISAAISSGLR